MTQIIYLHGLDSSSQATKAMITAGYAQSVDITVVRPDLNLPPQAAVDKIISLISKDSVLIGSSLGGYFANLVSDMTGVPAILLNPSIRPDVSFRRFLSDRFDGQNLHADTVIYRTTGGWDIVYGDLAWFEAHRLQVSHPDKIGVFLKLGDELLDASATQTFYQALGVAMLAQEGGDHTISDYSEHVKTVVDWAISLVY